MKKFYLYFLAVVITLTTNIALAQNFDTKHGNWSVYTMKKDGKNTCYLVGDPEKRDGTVRYPSQAYVVVTHIKGALDEVSTSSGYVYKKDSVKAKIDDKKFGMFTKKKLAWAFDDSQDKKMISLMKAGKKLIINALSFKNNNSKDIYSLKGFTRAHKRMKSLCK